MIATRDGRRGVKILIAHMRYRLGRSEPLSIRVIGVPPTASLTRYEIDRLRSDSIDAGLERVAAPALSGSKLSVSLPACSVTLLVVRPR
jgi:hypothetical protein